MKPLYLIIGGLLLMVVPMLPATIEIPIPSWSIMAPVTKADAAVYVYEKDSSAVPSAVMAAMNRLNREKGILATAFEDDTTDGDGEVPEQYREPLKAAKEAGLPCMVFMGGGKVVKVVKAPTTVEAILEVVP